MQNLLFFSLPDKIPQEILKFRKKTKEFNTAKSQISSDNPNPQNFTANFQACWCKGRLWGSRRAELRLENRGLNAIGGETKPGSRSGCPGRGRAKSSRSKRSEPAAGRARARARGSLPAGSAGSGTKPFCECHPGDESCTSAAARRTGVKEGFAGRVRVQEEEPSEARRLKTFRAASRAQPVRRAGIQVGLTN